MHSSPGDNAREGERRARRRARDEELDEGAQGAPAMLDRLESSLAAQRQLLDDVRHELRTPLTIVRGHLETMDVLDATDVEQTRRVAVAELDRMDHLIDDIDLLAAIEAGERLRRDPVEVATLTSDVGTRASAIDSHPWRVAELARDQVVGDGERLVQAWLQLAQNAAKYAPEGTPIEIGSTRDGEWVRLWVRDHGPGVPPGMRHRIFRRFDRGASRRDVGGSGLGLAIVDAISKAHDGSCAVADTPGGGATFTISLPVGDAPQTPVPVRAEHVVLQREATA